MASMPQKQPVAAQGSARCLVPRASVKPWGRCDLGPWGGALASAEKIGEIHHQMPGATDPELLVKTLFTGERLSVQVHPDAAAATAAGHHRGKDEAWVVLAADPGATIGLGLKSSCTPDALRAAALDGSIIDLMIWHNVAPGDVLYSPAGTIHAIGAGVTLFEVQQNLDLTYRLFDYGRDRELHLDAALSVANLSPWAPPAPLPSPGRGRELLVEGSGFVLERLTLSDDGMVCPADGRPVWIAFIGGTATLGGVPTSAGEIWHTDSPVPLAGDATVLVAYAGAAVVPDLWQPYSRRASASRSSVTG